MAMNVQCPKCKVQVPVDKDEIGEVLRCPECSAKFRAWPAKEVIKSSPGASSPGGASSPAAASATPAAAPASPSPKDDTPDQAVPYAQAIQSAASAGRPAKPPPLPTKPLSENPD